MSKTEVLARFGTIFCPSLLILLEGHANVPVMHGHRQTG